MFAGELLLGAEDHHPVRPAAVQGGGRQAEVHLQADGQGQKGGSSFFLSTFFFLTFQLGLDFFASYFRRFKQGGVIHGEADRAAHRTISGLCSFVYV